MNTSKEKLLLVSDFIKKNGLSAEDLCNYSALLKKIKADREYEILYDDGSISKQILLTKIPLALKIDSFWVKFGATSLPRMTIDESIEYAKKISLFGKEWYPATSGEVYKVFNDCSDFVLIETIFNSDSYLNKVKLHIWDRTINIGGLNRFGRYEKFILQPLLDVYGSSENLENFQRVHWLFACDAK